MELRYSKDVHDHFILEEGMRNKAYLDTRGYWTIGIGHMLGRDDEFRGMYWTDIKALMTLENDIDTAVVLAKDVFPEWDVLPDNVKLALMDMCFNLGNRFRQFKQTIRLIHNGRYKEAAESAAQSLWARQVPNRARRVLKILAGD